VSLSPPSCHFQTGGARGVSLQGFDPSTKPRRLVTVGIPS
jgi:hypothetical protein